MSDISSLLDFIMVIINMMTMMKSRYKFSIYHTDVINKDIYIYE